MVTLKYSQRLLLGTASTIDKPSLVRTHLLLSLAGLLLPQWVAAEKIELDTVEVVAPTSQETIGAYSVDPKDLATDKNNSMGNTTRLLETIPGLSTSKAGGVSHLPVIRGLADNRIRVKIDDMDLIASCPNHMNPPLSYLDPTNVEQLTVFRSVAPVSVGGDSIGGSILVTSPAPRFATPSGEALTESLLNAGYSSNNDAFSLGFTTHYATETVSMRYSGAGVSASNYEAGSDFKSSEASGRPGHDLPLDEVGSTAYNTWNHSLDYAVKREDRLFSLKLGYQHMPDQGFPNQRMDMLDNEQTRIRAEYTDRLTWGDFQLGAYIENVDHLMDFGPDKRFWYGMASMTSNSIIGQVCSPVGPTCAAGMPMISESQTTGMDVMVQSDLTDTTILRTGMTLQRYRLDDYWEPSGARMWPNRFQNINDGKRSRIAFFSEWDSELTERLSALLGVRYERLRTSSETVSGYNLTATGQPTFQQEDSAAFNARDRQQADDNIDIALITRFTPSHSLALEFGLARQVRSPSLYERYTWSSWSMAAVMNNTIGDGNGYIGDVGLKPEVAHTASLVIDLHDPTKPWQLSLSPYYTHVDHYIDATARIGWLPNQFNVLQYSNQSARLYGMEIVSAWSMGQTEAGEWQLDGIINYTNGTNRETGNNLYQIMPLHARFTISRTHTAWRNTLELLVVDEKDELSLVRNEVPTAGFSVLNLRNTYTHGNLELSFGAENLFDRLYAHPSSGAYIGQGWTMGLRRVPWGTVVPAMGRSIYASIAMTF